MTVPLANILKSVFGADTRLGSEAIQTLLLLVMRNATTDFPLADFEQSLLQIQRCEFFRLQPEITAMAVGAGKHGNNNPVGTHVCGS